jgi:AraC-like DNA-binding protein
MDVMSATLSGLSIRSRSWGLSALTAPWGFALPASVDEVPMERWPAGTQLSEDRRAASSDTNLPDGWFYALLEGSCVLEVEGADPVNLRGGDIAILPRHRRHCLRDAPQSAVRPIWELVSFDDLRRRNGLRTGGGGAKTSLLCGGIVYENGPLPWQSTLPPVMQLGRGGPCSWIDDALRILASAAVDEMAGAQALIDHSVHLLFVQSVRACLSSTGAGVALDPEISKALALLHGGLDTVWTVASLADRVAMSRSAFAARFTELVGEPPMRYVGRARMRHAANLLTTTTVAIKQIARRVGYESEAAFSNAFKRNYGESPAGYRRRNGKARVERVPSRQLG